MKRISIVILGLVVLFSAVSTSEAGHAAGCTCGVCRQQLVVQQLYSPYVVVPPFFYQVGQDLREEALAKRAAEITASEEFVNPIAEKTSDLVIQKLKNLLNIQPPPAAPVTPPATPPATTPPATNPPTVTPPAQPATPPAVAPKSDKRPTGAELTNAVQALFNKKCVSCHSPTSKNQKPFLHDLAASPPTNPWKIWGVTHRGTMPKRDATQTEEDWLKSLATDEEVDLLGDWVLELDP